jgi:hypothetical protein
MVLYSVAANHGYPPCDGIIGSFMLRSVAAYATSMMAMTVAYDKGLP